MLKNLRKIFNFDFFAGLFTCFIILIIYMMYNRFFRGLESSYQILVLGLIILPLALIPVFKRWRHFQRFLKSYTWVLYILFFITVIIVIIGLFIFDLKNKIDRVLFREYIEFSLVLILFVELVSLVLILFVEIAVDSRKRKRYIVYGKQIDVILEFSKIIQDAREMLEGGYIDKKWELGMRIDDFIESGRYLIVEHRIWKAEEKLEREIGPICGAIKKVHDYSELYKKEQEYLLFELNELFQILADIIEEELEIL